MTRKSGRQRLITILWLAILCFIPLLSFTGRGLRRVVYASVSPGLLAMIFLFISAVVAAGILLWAKRRGGFSHSLGLSLLLVFFLVAPMYLPLVDERIHFLVFGGFGFFSLLLFSPLIAVVTVLLVGGLDEVLQWLLPDRVGDWRDVAFNVLAGLGGIGLAWLGKDS